MFQAARVKLTAWYGLTLAGVLLGVGVGTYFVARNALDNEITTNIDVARTQLASFDPTRFTVRSTPGGYGEKKLDPRPTVNTADLDDEEDTYETSEDDDATATPSAPQKPDYGPKPSGDWDDDRGAATILASEVFFVTATADGTILTNPRLVDLEGVDLAALAADADAGDHWADVESESHRYRISTYALPPNPQTGQSQGYLYVAQGLDGRDRDLRALVNTMLLAGVVGVVLSVGGGYLLAARALSPIRKTMEAQRRFVSDASHELRTPVAVVRANNELLQLHPEQRVGENLEQVEAIAAEAEHMSRLVDDLLLLARADEGRLRVNEGLVDLGELTGYIVRDLTALAEQRDVRLEMNISPALVEGDEMRLRQLGMILVDNAIKYTPAGGRVHVSCHAKSGRVELVVRDNGPGIAAEDLPHLFDRFWRTDAARTRGDASGTGLGLAIAQEIAHAHSGRLTVESKPGQGTAFILRVKAASS